MHVHSATADSKVQVPIVINGKVHCMHGTCSNFVCTLLGGDDVRQRLAPVSIRKDASRRNTRPTVTLSAVLILTAPFPVQHGASPGSCVLSRLHVDIGGAPG